MDAERKRKFLFYHLVIDFFPPCFWLSVDIGVAYLFQPPTHIDYLSSWCPLFSLDLLLYLALLHLHIFSYFCLYTSAKFIPGLLPRSYIRYKFDPLNHPYCCWIQASKHRWRLSPHDEVSIYSIGTDPAHGEKHQASNQSYSFIISTNSWF